MRVHAHHRESTLFRHDRAARLRLPDGATQEVVLRIEPGPGGRLIGRLRGLVDRDVARGLMGADILVERTALPAPEPGEFYIADVVGKPVFHDNARVGTLTWVHPGPVELLEVAVGADTAWVPCDEEHVAAVGSDGIVLRRWDGP